MANTAENKTATTNKFDIKVTHLNPFAIQDGIRYGVNFEGTIPGRAQNKDGDIVDTDVSHISFSPSRLIAQLIEQIPSLAIAQVKKKEQSIRKGDKTAFGLDCAELSIVLGGSTLSIERRRYEAGEEYTDSEGDIQVHENAGYDTEIVSIALNPVFKKAMEARESKAADNLLDLMFG